MSYAEMKERRRSQDLQDLRRRRGKGSWIYGLQPAGLGERKARPREEKRAGSMDNSPQGWEIKPSHAVAIPYKRFPRSINPAKEVAGESDFRSSGSRAQSQASLSYAEMKERRRSQDFQDFREQRGEIYHRTSGERTGFMDYSPQGWEIKTAPAETPPSHAVAIPYKRFPRSINPAKEVAGENNFRSSGSRAQSQASLSYAEMKERRRSQDFQDLRRRRGKENWIYGSQPAGLGERPHRTQ